MTVSNTRLSSRLLKSLLNTGRLTTLELQSSSTAAGKNSVRTFDVLNALAFGTTRQAKGAILYPFTAALLNENAANETFVNTVDEAGNDVLYTHTSLQIAQLANQIMHTSTAHAAVRAGCSAFVNETATLIGNWLDMFETSLGPIARAHWQGIVAALVKKPEPKSSSGSMGGLMQMFGKEVQMHTAVLTTTGKVTEKWREEMAMGELMHSGCTRCRHDPYRTQQSRQMRAMEMRRAAVVHELKQTLLMGNL